MRFNQNYSSFTIKNLYRKFINHIREQDEVGKCYHDKQNDSFCLVDNQGKELNLEFSYYFNPSNDIDSLISLEKQVYNFLGYEQEGVQEDL